MQAGSEEEERCAERDGAESDAEESPVERGEGQDFAREGRNSAKSSYLAKALGPVLGYGSTYELFQFVYDLWLWSALGAKKHVTETPLRLAMSGYAFSPEYWHTRHAALVDIVKQLGLPTLFVTVAPYEWSFPYPTWLEDEAAKMLRSKLRLPVAESLHIAHILAQLVQGLMTGANSTTDRKKNPWRSHIFAAKDGSNRKTVVNFFGRLEYQDGKRKRYVNQQEVAAQFYHGRGTVHVHLLLWLEHIETIQLEKVVAASVPAENEVLAALVQGSQRSWTGSGWPRHDGPSYYDGNTGILHLHHSAEDYCTQSKNGTNEGVRAYLVDVLGSLACHVDVQASDGRGMLLRYVSGYVPKFSDAFTTEWLNDEASDYMVAKRVLTDYHPLEPEMALQLAMQWFPQCFLGGTMQRFRVPVPFETDKTHARVQQYLQSTWRAKDMTLEEFLRKTNQKGSIHRTLQRRHTAARAAAGQEGLLEDTLEEWANQAPVRGEVAVAAMYLSRYTDRYYGQWVLMKVPFQQLEELHVPELDLVPDHLYYQAMALHHRPDHWQSEAAVRAELELEAFREYHVRNIWAMLQANHILIQDYVNGTLNKFDEAPTGNGALPRGPAGEKPPLSRQQQLVVDDILASVDQSYKRQAAKDEEWQGEGPEEPLFPDARLPHAFAVLGPAGSGKSTAVCEAVEKVAGSGGRVLLTAPTGRLAATLREKFPNLEVDTMHGAFLLWKPVQETFEVMFPYDMIVVEEVGQVSCQNFERIVQQWEAADRLPTLVFVGDFCQLEGVDRSNALQSNVWHSAAVKKYRLNTMMRCKCPVLRKKLELLRTAKPSKAQLKTIVSGHKAPSLKRAGYVMAEEPSQDDVKHILEETPHTLFVTISRQACAKLNALAVEVLFEEAMPLAWVPGDPESNVENYEHGRKVADEPLPLPVHQGARVILTKNLNKAIGFVNGMGATIVAMRNGNVFVKTDQGKLLAVHPWTSPDPATGQLRVHFPMRLGYASTLHKVQGATLPHITLWLDVANMPAAAYVALSRVEYDAN